MRLGYNDQKVQETLDLFNPQLVGVTFIEQREFVIYKISYWEAKPVFETGNFSRKERRKAYWTLHRLAEQDTSGKVMVSEKKCV